VVEVGETLEKLSGIIPTRIQAPVAVVYDFENEWALNNALLPRSQGKNYQETCRRHYGTFWKRGVATDIIHAEADLSSYRIVVAPMLYMFRPGVAERIEQFVQAGGIFVTSYLSGVVNESDLCFINGYPPALRRTLGVYSEEIDALTDQQTGQIVACDGNALGLTGNYSFHQYAELIHTENAHVLAAYASEFYAGYPALTVNRYGKGQAYTIAARTEDRFLQDVYDGILKQAGLNSLLPFTIPEGVSVQSREGDKERYTFLMNFNNAERRVEVGSGLTDALTGKVMEPSVVLQPYDLAILVEGK
jgi:beta-galactosidase